MHAEPGRRIFRSGEWTQNFCWRWNCKFCTFCVSLYAKEWDLICSFRHATSICTIIPSCQCDLASWLQQCCERWNAHNHVAPENRVSQKRHLTSLYISTSPTFSGETHVRFRELQSTVSKKSSSREPSIGSSLLGFFRGRTPLLLQCSWRDLWMSGPERVWDRMKIRMTKILKTSRMVASAFYRCPWRWQEAKSNFSGVSSPWSRYRLLKSACWTWDLGIRIK